MPGTKLVFRLWLYSNLVPLINSGCADLWAEMFACWLSTPPWLVIILRHLQQSHSQIHLESKDPCQNIWHCPLNIASLSHWLPLCFSFIQFETSLPQSSASSWYASTMENNAEENTNPCTYTARSLSYLKQASQPQGAVDVLLRICIFTAFQGQITVFLGNWPYALTHEFWVFESPLITKNNTISLNNHFCFTLEKSRDNILNCLKGQIVCRNKQCIFCIFE